MIEDFNTVWDAVTVRDGIREDIDNNFLAHFIWELTPEEWAWVAEQSIWLWSLSLQLRRLDGSTNGVTGI